MNTKILYVLVLVSIVLSLMGYTSWRRNEDNFNSIDREEEKPVLSELVFGKTYNYGSVYVYTMIDTKNNKLCYIFSTNRRNGGLSNYCYDIGEVGNLYGGQ